ncbi:MAG: division/cell wall cluster transcriptional repressor MraZ [Verrucomicrobiia bacterium]
MSASASSGEVIYYTSLYRHGVDEKRRVQIPAKWQPADASIEFTLILWPKGTMLEACLLVLPPAEWDALVQKLKGLPFADPKAQELRRIIGRNSDRVTVDKSGRICLPEEMAKAAAIDDRAVLLGMVDRFEIWNPERYQEMSAADTDERQLDVFRQI